MKKLFSASAWLLFLCFVFAAQVCAAPGNEKHATISVRGEAALNVPADRFNMDIGVTATAKEVEKAVNEASRRLNDIIRALEKGGLSQDEYQTRRFEVQPQWSPRPKNAAPEWRPEIIGFTVSTSLSIRTLKLEAAGVLLADAVAAGANEIGSLYFDLADKRKYRDQAIREAVAAALEDAETMARAAGVAILRVLSLDLDYSRPSPFRMNLDRGGSVKSIAAPEPPALVAGDVSVRANVSMVCEIGPEK